MFPTEGGDKPKENTWITIKYILRFVLALLTRQRKRYHFSAVVLRSGCRAVNKKITLMTGCRRRIFAALRHYQPAAEILPGFVLRSSAFLNCAFSPAPKVACRKSVAPVTP
ncbi:hypothetical protein [Gibbsiella quercinecans]|uniref:hypothetical protein n=1 Tax=Gibbsiella quercinecans TaxID=929813 RepID=UPI003A4D532C